MKYRTFPKTGEKVSLMGLGTMRLPVYDKEETRPILEEGVKMIRRAIDLGVNYIDTAYMYHGGKSEEIVGAALKDGYREKVFLADKMPVWMARQAGGIEALFQQQFDRLQVDYIDMYLVHALDKGVWKLAQKLEAIPFLEAKKAEGKIKHLGFSFHDDLELFKEIIDAYPWDFCQIQLNYMDSHFQAGLEGLEYAASKGIPVVIMEPLKGGKLVNVPEDIAKLFDSLDKKYTEAGWALRWLADRPEIMTILSGASSMEQMEENIATLSDADANALTAEEKKVIEEVKAAYKRRIKADCTGCRYCQPCPMSIDIPEALRLYNDWHLYHNENTLHRDMALFLPKGKPVDCVGCHECDFKCPQKLPIANIMQEMKELCK